MSKLFENINDFSYDAESQGQELTCLITGGFVGIQRGESVMSCIIDFVVTTPGEFFGQKYKYNAKIYDMDASKRDLAMRNLAIIGMSSELRINEQSDITTESIKKHWAGKVRARVSSLGFFLPYQ